MTEWLISDGGNTVGGSFAGSYTLGTANQGNATTWGDLEVLFGSAFSISGNICTLQKDITIDSSVNTGTFPIDMPGDGTNTYTFDGGSDNNYTITIEDSYGENWSGLFKPVADAKLNIQNVDIVINKTIAVNCGALIGTAYDDSLTNDTIEIGGGTNVDNPILITNCHVSGTVETPGSGGGLLGSRYGYSDGKYFKIENCSNSLEISGENGGGICGVRIGRNSYVTILNCKNVGEISGDNGGGICGRYAGVSGLSIIVKHCQNTGDISGNYSGGICGRAVSMESYSDNIIEYCWNEGELSGNGSGGIIGRASCYNGGNLLVQYCYNTADFTGGTEQGGICGERAGQKSGQVIVFHCYSISNGQGSSAYQGGICGRRAGSDNNSDTNYGTVYVFNCWVKGTDLKKGIVSTFVTNSTVEVYNCYYVGDSDTTSYTDHDNNLKSNIWYEGYANKTINSDSDLADIDKDINDLKWYDSFDQAEKDDDFRTKFGDYITRIKVKDRPNQAVQTKYLEVGLRTKEGTMVDYAFGDATNGGDVEWVLSGENYFISDAPRIQLQSKTPSENEVVTFTRVELLTGTSSSDILVTTENAAGGKSGSIWHRTQTSTEGYKVKVETNYRRGGSDWISTGEPVDVIKDNNKGWHNNYSDDEAPISFWRVTIQDDGENDMPNMNPWLITDDVSGWGGTSFEDDQ